MYVSVIHQNQRHLFSWCHQTLISELVHVVELVLECPLFMTLFCYILCHVTDAKWVANYTLTWIIRSQVLHMLADGKV